MSCDPHATAGLLLRREPAWLWHRQATAALSPSSSSDAYLVAATPCRTVPPASATVGSEWVVKSLSAARQRKCCRTPRCKQRRGATSDLQRLSCKTCMTVIGIEQLPGKPKRDHPTSVMKNQTSETKSKTMKIVIIGGTGLVGAKLLNNLRQQGHEVVAASPSQGINSVTGEGLARALTGAQVVVDVSNAPSWEDNAVLEFFESSTRNLLAAEAVAGVRHHVALSVVGTDRLLASGYFRAKMAQEKMIQTSPIPYTIVRATQFFEFVGGIAQSATQGQTVRLPPVLMQPVGSDDVAAVMADVALAEPLNGTFDLAGPEPIRQDDLVRRFLNATRDARTVITDPKALYFGITVNDQSLTPDDPPRLGPTRFEDWLSHKVDPGA